MEETYRTKAIILGRQLFREYDAKISIYSANKGRIELVARGIKRQGSKLAGHLEPMSLVNIMAVRGRRFDYVGSAVSENCYANIKGDLDKLYAAGQAIGIFKKFIREEEKDYDIFKLLANFLKLLDRAEQVNYQMLADFLIFKLLVALGYRPELYNCVVCHKKVVPGGNKLNFIKGGLACKDCSLSEKRDSLTISNDCIKILRLAAKSDLEELTKLKLSEQLYKEARNIVSSFLKFNF